MKLQRSVFIAGAGAILCGLAVLAALAVTTGRLENLLRHRIVSAMQNATGGRVAIQAMHFKWQDLSAELDGVSIRPPEPANAPPFFEADRVRMQFKIVSVLRRQIDLASLKLIRPKFRFNGGLQGLQKPVQLRVRHLEIAQGDFQADLGQFDLRATGDELSASVVRDSRRACYHIAISAKRLQAGSGNFQIDAGGSMAAQLESGQLTVSRLSLSSGQDSLEASGTVRSFAHPVADFAIRAGIRAADLARLASVQALEVGRFDLAASLHYDPQNSFALNGKLSGRQLAWRFHGWTLRNVDLNADIASRNRDLYLSNTSIYSLGGKIAGTAVLRNLNTLDFDGSVAGARIREALRFITGQSLDWAGSASGHVHLTGDPTNFVLSAAVGISPLAGNCPISGNLQFTYRSRSGAIQFGSSQLNLPQTRVAFSGTPRGTLDVAIQTRQLDEVQPVFAFAPMLKAALPEWLWHSEFQFSGQIADATVAPQVQGDVILPRIPWRAGFSPRGASAPLALQAHVKASRGALEIASFRANGTPVSGGGSVRVALKDWALQPESALTAKAHFKNLDLATIASAYAPGKLQISAGTASGSLDFSGTLANPLGSVQISANGVVIGGQRLDSADASLNLVPGRLWIQHARLASGPASATLSGVYQHAAGEWANGSVRVKVDSNGFPLASLAALHLPLASLAADLQIHGSLAARVSHGSVEPVNADGVLMLRNITFRSVRLGSARVDANTSGDVVTAKLSGNIGHGHVAGSIQIDTAPGAPSRGALQVSGISLAALDKFIHLAPADSLPVTGWAGGGIDFDGPLQHPDRMHALIHVDQLQARANLPAADLGAKANEIIFRNQGALVLDIDNGVAKIRSFRLAGTDVALAVLGSIPCTQGKPLDLTIGGSVGLRLFELVEPGVRASGQSVLQASVRGTLPVPVIQGELQVHNGSFFLDGISNGLSDVNGTVSFDRNRATIQTMTAMSGGGSLRLGGFVSFGAGPLVYNLQARAENVRTRSEGNLSVTASGTLQLSGTSSSSVLSGNVSVSHIVLNANSDLGGLLASLSAPMPSPGNEKGFISGLQFDVHIVSAPNLQLSSLFGRDLEPDIDLRLRGTPGQPVLLGSVSATRGEIKVFGTKYTINHADVYFNNPVRIEPTVDLDLQTQAHGVLVDITVAGALNKLNINYRSDPPMQPRDIIALLAVGEAPGTAANAVNAPTAAETAALQSSANTVLGQAISPNSGRLSKLFGITNVKIDPLAQGSTVTPESRLTVQQQISRDITVTYVTNLAQTSEQIFRLEWALNTQYSVVAVRDDNGEFGIDIQYKKRF